MAQIPRDKNLDSTLAFLRDPYRFISKRCERYKSDIFQTRLAFQDTLCMRGRDAAELFYDPERFQRKGAMPGVIQKTLTGEGGVQGLDYEAHRHRKQMFMSLVTPEQVKRLTEITTTLWHTYARKWASMERVPLYDEMRELLSRAVCAWSGVPLEETEVRRRKSELTALFAYAGSVGPLHLWSRLARRRAERWIEEHVEHIRSRKLNPSEQSAIFTIALHREPNGDLLSPHVAAVELLNVLRPTVAVSVFIVFAAHAMHEQPEVRQRLATGEEDYAERFVQEVRRFYPFFPSAVARVRRDFNHKGYSFNQGTRALLDLYGTNPDARTWNTPEAFQPDRFLTWDGSPFNFIPQGGGNPAVTHRCPGEGIAVELMKAAVGFLTRDITYDVPDQNLELDFSRLPALPRSRFVVSSVRPNL